MTGPEGFAKAVTAAGTRSERIGGALTEDLKLDRPASSEGKSSQVGSGSLSSSFATELPGYNLSLPSANSQLAP